MTEPEHECFAEWKVRKIPKPPKDPQDTYVQRLRTWALSSIGIDGKAKELLSYIEDSKTATIQDLASYAEESPEEVLERVDLLYSTGLVDRLGKAYFVREPISTSIVKKLIPRITESLRSVARVESKSRSDADYYHKMRGRGFSDIGSAMVACKEITRAGSTPTARVVGVRSYNDESVEVEGPVIDYGHSPQHLVIITESGEKIVVGNKQARGADIKAHTIIVKGETNE